MEKYSQNRQKGEEKRRKVVLEVAKALVTQKDRLSFDSLVCL